MMWLRKLHALRRCERGATIVEFAMVLLPLCITIMGAMEMGYRIYAISVSNGAIREAARMASTGGFTGAQIDAQVTDQIHAFRSDAVVKIEKKSYRDFTGVGLPEPITSGSVESGTYCFDDINNNGNRDLDQGADGLGGAEDIIYYEVTTTYPTLFGFSQRFGMDPNTTVSLNTIVSNEPFAAVVRTTPPRVCK